MAKKGQRFNKYSKGYKQKVLDEKFLEGKSYSYLSSKYDIPEATIHTWVHQYRKHGNKLISKQRGRPKKEENIDYKEKYEILKKFQDYLEEVDQEKK